jgi:hypothetical protein
MKKVLFLLFLVFPMMLSGQMVVNPNISEKPLPTLSIPKVVTDGSTTTITIRITNSKQLAPFSIKTRELFIRPVSDQNVLNLIRADMAPFAPEKHIFTSLNEVFEFTLVFPALPKGTKYFDILDKLAKHEFYIQGVILDPKLNEMMTRGFDLFGRGDGNGALKAFTEFVNSDLYFEYGVAHFNIIYLLTVSNRIPEAQEWYDKWKDRFYYDKKLLESEMNRFGILKKLK